MIETLVFVLVLNIVGLLIAYSFKTDKLTDISYAVSFAGIALYNMLTNDMSRAQWVVFLLVMAWAARLGSFLLYRVSVKGKDGRFDEMRESFFAFGRFWVLQGVTAWVVMLPASFLLQSGRTTQLNTLAIVGASVAAAALLFEAVADWQKFKFSLRKNNKTPWIDEGLWKFSRHPNYFGEIMVWIGVYLASYQWLTDNQVFIALLSPLLIIVVLTAGTGIPILEKSADKKWGNKREYQEYKRRTSILLPLPKKR